MSDGCTLRALIPGEEIASDVLGVWQLVPAAAGRHEEAAIVWEVDVAAATGAKNPLEEPANRVAAAVQAIPLAENRLQRFLRQPDQGQSFAVPAAQARTPEARLAAWITPETDAFVSFGIRDEVAQALRQAGRFSEQVRRTLGQPALVKSSAGGRSFGRTRVSWTGDVDTAWGPGLGPVEAAVHERAVRLALATSQAWLRIVTLVAASAVQLSLLLPSGIGAITALPAAWDFVTGILDEYEHLRRLQTESARL